MHATSTTYNQNFSSSDARICPVVIVIALDISHTQRSSSAESIDWANFVGYWYIIHKEHYLRADFVLIHRNNQ